MSFQAGLCDLLLHLGKMPEFQIARELLKMLHQVILGSPPCSANTPVTPRKSEQQVRKRSVIFLKEVKGLSIDFISYSKLVTHALRDYADLGRKFDAEDFSAHRERLASELENYLQST